MPEKASEKNGQLVKSTLHLEEREEDMHYGQEMSSLEFQKSDAGELTQSDTESQWAVPQKSLTCHATLVE